MEVSDDLSKALEKVSRMTFRECTSLLNKVYTAVRLRQNRHFDATHQGIKNAVRIYTREHPFLDENGVPIEFGWYVWYVPQHEKDKFQYPTTLTLAFDYGEPYEGIRYDGENRKDECTEPSTYYVTLNDAGYATRGALLLKPPDHHIVSFPMSKAAIMTLFAKREEVTLKYEMDKNDCSPKLVLIQPAKNVRMAVYGPLAASFRDYFVRDDHYRHILDLACRVHRAYENYHIGKAKSATMMFLMIGRCRHLYKMPYDVVKFIAMDVWNSRYNNTLWEITLPEPTEEVLPGAGLPRRLKSEENPWEDPTNIRDIPEWIKQIPFGFYDSNPSKN